MEDVNGRDFTIDGGFLVISHYMNFLTAVKGIYANSNSEVAFPAFKATKHGTVTLVLSGRNFWIDVTIHMDVKANPGPGTDRVNVTPWPGGGGGTPIYYLYGYVPPNGVVILKFLI